MSSARLSGVLTVSQPSRETTLENPLHLGSTHASPRAGSSSSIGIWAGYISVGLVYAFLLPGVFGLLSLSDLCAAFAPELPNASRQLQCATRCPGVMPGLANVFVANYRS